MKNLIFFVFFTIGLSNSIYSQHSPTWGLRIGYSHFTEDQLGFGLAYHPDSSKWFHHFELYPFQNRGSDIVRRAVNVGFLARTNYVLNKPTAMFQFFTGAEVYGYRYSRIILGTEDTNIDNVAQLMGHVGGNVRLGERLNVNLVIPLIGFEYVNSKDSFGVSNNFTPLLIGFYGLFLPKIGVDISLF